MRIKRILAIALATAIATVLAVLLVINFSLGDKQIDRRIPHAYAVADAQFLRTMGVLLGPPLMNGNRVEALLNGDQIFPAMLDAIRGAKQTITFETYIYWSGVLRLHGTRRRSTTPSDTPCGRRQLSPFVSPRERRAFRRMLSPPAVAADLELPPP